MSSTLQRARTRFGDARQLAEQWLFEYRHLTYALALARIGLGASVLFMLMAGFGERGVWVGDGSVWSDPVREVSAFPEIAFMRNASGDVVTVVYLIAMAASAALMLGWRTRVAAAITLLGFIAIVGQNPMVGVPSDAAVRLSLLWLVLTHSGEELSLDARRRALGTQGEHDYSAESALPSWLLTSLHNIGVLGLLVQTVLLYTAAGLDKVAREAWRSGEALYATTQLPEFRPLPWLSDAVASSSLVLAVLTYGVLLIQLFFAPLMLTRWSRLLVGTLAILSSVFFAILFGSITGSMAIIAVTLLVIPEDVLETRVDGLVTRLAPVTEWIYDRWIPVQDRIEDGWYRVRDFVAVTILRR